MSLPNPGAQAELPGPEAAVDASPDRLRAEDRLTSADLVLLTSAARRGGTEAILSEVARLLNGWAALIDRYGKPISAFGAARIHIDDATSLALNRTRKIRNTAMQLQSVGHAEDPRAFLVVSARGGSEGRTRALALHAASLLDLTFFAQRDGKVDEIARADIIDVLLSGNRMLSRSLADRWGLTGERLVALALRSRSRAVVLETRVLEWLTELEVPLTTRELGGEIVVVLAPEVVPSWVAKVQAAAGSGLPVRCGIGRPMTTADLAVSLEQARQALDIAIADAEPCLLFDELPMIDLVIRNLSPMTISALYDPLRALGDEDSGNQLALSLRAFLAENGSWEAAASQLGIHRHTLKNRIQRVEDLTGLSMSRADDRFRAWLALQSKLALHVKPAP